MSQTFRKRYTLPSDLCSGRVNNRCRRSARLVAAPQSVRAGCSVRLRCGRPRRWLRSALSCKERFRGILTQAAPEQAPQPGRVWAAETSAA